MKIMEASLSKRCSGSQGLPPPQDFAFFGYPPSPLWHQPFSLSWIFSLSLQTCSHPPTPPSPVTILPVWPLPGCSWFPSMALEAIIACSGSSSSFPALLPLPNMASTTSAQNGSWVVTSDFYTRRILPYIHLTQLLIVYLLLKYSPLLVLLTKISCGLLTTSLDTPLGLFCWLFLLCLQMLGFLCFCPGPSYLHSLHPLLKSFKELSCMYLAWILMNFKCTSPPQITSLNFRHMYLTVFF